MKLLILRIEKMTSTTDATLKAKLHVGKSLKTAQKQKAF